MNRREFLKIGSMGVMTLVLGGCGLSSLTGESSGGQAVSSGAAGTCFTGRLDDGKVAAWVTSLRE